VYKSSVCQLLQTLLLPVLAVDPDAPPVAVLNSELAAVAAEKCCANVDTSEVLLLLLPLATFTAAAAAPTPVPVPVAVAVVLDVLFALDITAVAVVDGCTFVVVDDSDNDDVEDWEPNGDEDAIKAAAAEFAPPPYVTADNELEAELAAAEA